MAWEWVPPVSAAASAAIVGGIGVWATFRAGREGRQHAETMAKQTAEHAEKMAADERKHARLEEAYIDALALLERAGHWASQVRPLMDAGPSKPEAALPSIDKQIHVRARVNAYGSPQVKALLNEYFTLIREIFEADNAIARALEDERDGTGRHQVRSGHVRDYTQTWADLNDRLRPAERIRRERLEKKITDELQA